MKRFLHICMGFLLGALVMFLLLERPWLQPEEKIEGPGTPWSTYFMGGSR